MLSSTPTLARAPRVRLALLGGFQVRVDDGQPVTLPSGKVQALLAILALPPGCNHARDKLATLLWGGLGEAEARASLRQALFMVRKALPGVPLLVIAGDSVALDPAVVEVDLVQFERRVADGTPSAFEEAAVLYRGDLLSGLAVSEPAFEEWLLPERERFRELAIEALAKLLVHQRSVGSREAAVQTGLRLLALDPLQEPVHRTLMRLYVEQGRRAAALRQYQTCVATMQHELAAEPEMETKQLYQEILQGHPQETARRRPTTAASARGSDPTARVQSAAQQTPLIGRDDELTHREGADLVSLPARILTEARQFTHAEAGTLYLRDGNRLRFAAIQNDVLERRLGEQEMMRLFPADLPLRESSFPGFVARSGNILRVSDAYDIPTNRPYTFYRAIDAQTEYRTRSVLVVPLQEPAGNVIGVLQLINALDTRNQVVPFDPDSEELVRALASLATVAVRNAQLGEVARGRAAVQFVASLAITMAHEINSPLTVIKENIQLIVRAGEALDLVSRQRIDAVLSAAETIRESVARLNRFAELKLADHSRAEGTMGSLGRHPFFDEAETDGKLEHPS